MIKPKRKYLIAIVIVFIGLPPRSLSIMSGPEDHGPGALLDERDEAKPSREGF